MTTFSPTRAQAALKEQADELLERMGAGELCPEEATHCLSALADAADGACVWPDLCGFHHLAIEWDLADRDGGDECDALRAQMLAEAERILGNGGVRIELVPSIALHEYFTDVNPQVAVAPRAAPKSHRPPSPT